MNLKAQNLNARRDPRIDSLIDNLGKVRNLYQTAISPDGARIAWVVDGEEQGKRSGSEIEVAPRTSPEKPIRITAGSKGELCVEGSLAWSPDSKTLAFLSDCQSAGENKTQADFYLAEMGNKPKIRRLTHLPGIPEAPAFSPDGKELGFLYVEGATRRASPLAAEKPPAGVIGEEGLEIKRVAEADIASGQVRQITPASLYTYEFDWSPGSQELAYIAAPPPGENNWWVAQLYTQPIVSDKPTSILDPANTLGPLHGLQIAVPRWSPDGKSIAFIGGLMSDQGVTGGDVYVVAAGGGTPVNLTMGRTSTAAWIYWRIPGEIEFTEIVGGSSRLSTIMQKPGSSEVLRIVEDFTAPAKLGDGTLDLSLSRWADNFFYIESSFASPPEVWVEKSVDAECQGNCYHPQQITHYNDSLKPAWGKAESITWISSIQPSPTIPASDATKDFNVQGWLLYPADYDPAKKYPLIVHVHGGPSSAELPRWPEVGYGPAPFAALGYFVLMPNPRGSYGQGEAFTQANRKDFGYGDLRDILAGVDAVTKSHNIDPERVGITGWSYGGFMTMFAVTQTNRFRAAVAGAGISNWQSYYGQNSIDQWMTPFMGASVYDDPGVYAKMSAINFIHNVKTPTLAVVGDRDGECPAPQSFEFWHALKAQHVPAQLVVYPNEGHHFVDPEHQRDVIARALAWFQKYMPAQ
ncbi:tolB protein [Acidisarcina polymorpha]|uniref:TolB protein n=1 Tax=Acidisarcina polymorpha TaxID=2211140 RepID=A0A2Z5G4Q3_9BACT|nr:tolB protein [Acidisarcina polymorpha]